MLNTVIPAAFSAEFSLHPSAQFDVGLENELINCATLPESADSSMVEEAIRLMKQWSVSSPPAVRGFAIWAVYRRQEGEAIPPALEPYKALFEHVEYQTVMSVRAADYVEPEKPDLNITIASSSADFLGFEQSCAVCFEYELDPLLPLLHDYTREGYVRFVARCPDSDEVIATTSVLRVTPARTLVNEVTVKPAYRRRGFGKAIVAAACRYAIDQWSPEELELAARVDAGSLYDLFGFRDNGLRSWELVFRPPAATDGGAAAPNVGAS